MLVRRYVIGGLLFCFVAAAGGAAYMYRSYVIASWQTASAAESYQTDEEQNDVYVRFVMEGYDIIQKNYWQKLSDEKLAAHFQRSLEKAAATPTPLTAFDRPSVAKMTAAAMRALSSDEGKKKLAVATLQVAALNLAPQGRSQLLSTEEQKAVQDTVNNVNPATGKAEPVIFRTGVGSTLYISIDRMSPATVSEFAAVLEEASTMPYSTMIIDLRGNIGGALDQIPNLLGLFLGPNQYTFDLSHQENLEVIRSSVPKLVALDRYQEIAVLTDSMSQSSAEVFAAAMKRFNLATVIGESTRGWGTVEGTYPLEAEIDPTTKYALMLVAGLTLRDDNQPIDGVGVDPDISIKEAAWQTKLPQHFRSPSLIEAIKETAAKPPSK